MAVRLLSLLFIAALMLSVQALQVPPPSQLYSTLIAQKILATASNATSPPEYPQFTDRTAGKWQYFEPDTWTSGFFPSTLYALNTRAQLCPQANDSTLLGTDWLSLAREWSAAEVSLESSNTLGHDVGFVSFPFQEELLVNPQNQTAVDVVNAFAADLAARFNPTVGCTRSWDTTDPTNFQVIIDNMMNIEVLMASANLTNNDTLRQMAISHADKTMQNHVRSDGSSFHVVEYNATTGAVVKQFTSQGFADNSTWSRGQAWGIYGFSQMARSTGLPRYLDTARSMATYFISNMPTNGVVPWDFNAPTNPPRPADSSAATIVTNSLLILSQLEQSQSPANTSGSQLWLNSAMGILNNITSLAWQPSWESLLANGTVNNPAHPPNNLTGIVYGDYYYVKTGNDLLSMALVNCADVNLGNTTNLNATGSSGSGSAPSGSAKSSSASIRFSLVTNWTLYVVIMFWTLSITL